MNKCRKCLVVYVTGAITANESLFDYGDRDWDYYNDPDFRPPFLDEVLANATDEQRAAAEDTCGDDRACLFDYLAVGPSLGADSMETGAEREAEQQSLGKKTLSNAHFLPLADSDICMLW